MGSTGSGTIVDKIDKIRHSKFGRPLFYAFVMQAVLLLSTVYIVVILPMTKSDPVFSTKKTIYLPQRELEHRMAVSQLQQAMKPPVMIDRLTTKAQLPDHLPKLPPLPEVDYKPLTVDMPLNDMNSLLGQSGLLGGADGITGAMSKISFFGVEDEASRIVIVFDVSKTVTNSVVEAGFTMDQVRSETARVVQQLSPNTLFGFIQFARNHDRFRDYMIPATQGNKEVALQWLNSEFRTSGSGRGWARWKGRNGIETIMEIAFLMEPDVIIVLSDANFYRSVPNKTAGERVPYDELESLIDRLQEGLEKPARIHFIGFGVKGTNQKGMKKIIRKNKGRYKEYH